MTTPDLTELPPASLRVRRAGVAGRLGLDLLAHTMEPVMRPATGGLFASLAFTLAATMFVLDTQLEGIWWLPGIFLTLAAAFWLKRRQPLPPPPDPQRLATARAVLAALGAEPVTLDLDLSRDPWLRIELEARAVALGTNGALQIEPADAELHQRLAGALD